MKHISKIIHTLLCMGNHVCVCSWLHLHVNVCKKYWCVHARVCECECLSMNVCICACVIPSSTHYSSTYPHVAFTSDLCSAARTITERPNSSANVHHIHPVSSLPLFLTLPFSTSDLVVVLIQSKKRRKQDMEFYRVKLYLFCSIFLKQPQLFFSFVY